MKPLTAEEIASLHNRIGGYGDEFSEDLGYRLLDEVERSRALLKRIEWGRHDDECPECGEDAIRGEDGETIIAKHKPDCELAALIGETK